MLISRSKNNINFVFLFSLSGRSVVVFFFLSVVVPLGCLLSKHADHRDIKSWTAPKCPPSGFFPLWSSSLTAFRSPWPPISLGLPFFPTSLSLDIRAQCLMGFSLFWWSGQKKVFAAGVCLKKIHMLLICFSGVALGVFYTLTHFAKEKLDRIVWRVWALILARGNTFSILFTYACPTVVKVHPIVE